MGRCAAPGRWAEPKTGPLTLLPVPERLQQFVFCLGRDRLFRNAIQQTDGLPHLLQVDCVLFGVWMTNFPLEIYLQPLLVEADGFARITSFGVGSPQVAQSLPLAVPVAKFAIYHKYLLVEADGFVWVRDGRAAAAAAARSRRAAPESAPHSCRSS